MKTKKSVEELFGGSFLPEKLKDNLGLIIKNKFGNDVGIIRNSPNSINLKFYSRGIIEEYTFGSKEYSFLNKELVRFNL